MSNLPSTDSPQIQLMYEWNRGFETKDLGLIAKALHKDYRHISYPRSLGLPEQNKEEWLEFLGRDFDHWVDHKPTIHSITETPGKVVLHVTSNAKTTLGVDVIRESIIIAQIVTDDDGSLKIKQIEDFTDSKSHFDTIEKIMAAKAK